VKKSVEGKGRPRRRLGGENYGRPKWENFQRRVVEKDYRKLKKKELQLSEKSKRTGIVEDSLKVEETSRAEEVSSEL
jgi:hypothetical protein